MEPSNAQPCILAPPPRTARSLVFTVFSGNDPRPGLGALAGALDPASALLGIGAPIASRALEGLRMFPALVGPGCAVPSTQGAVWVELRDGDRGELEARAKEVQRLLGDGFCLEEDVECFLHREGRDLTGYEDGTENPVGEAAREAALVRHRDPRLHDGSFVAVQRWVHDLARFARFSPDERDQIIGRRLVDNEELEDAPERAHVKRTAQESFDPAAFMVRRSLPWVSGERAGLLFIAFGESLDRYERVLRRMVGADDGIVDALFAFSRAVSGGYYFCPPVRDGRVAMHALVAALTPPP